MGSGRLKRLQAVAGPDIATTYTFHVTDREAWALVMHSFSTPPQNDVDRRRQLDFYAQLNLMETWNALTTKAGLKLDMNDFDAVQYELAKNVSKNTLDYIDEILNKPIQTLYSIILGGFAERTRAVRRGDKKDYECPPDNTDPDKALQ